MTTSLNVLELPNLPAYLGTYILKYLSTTYIPRYLGTFMELLPR